MPGNMEDKRYLEEEKIGIEPSPAVDVSSSEEALPYLRNSTKHGFLGRLRSFEDAMDRRLGVESHAITRKRPEDKDPRFAVWHNQAVMFLLWLSATMNLSCFTTGFLGWEFGLDLNRNITIIVFATLLGSAVTVSPAGVSG